MRLHSSDFWPRVGSVLKIVNIISYGTGKDFPICIVEFTGGWKSEVSVIKKAQVAEDELEVEVPKVEEPEVEDRLLDGNVQVTARSAAADWLNQVPVRSAAADWLDQVEVPALHSDPVEVPASERDQIDGPALELSQLEVPDLDGEHIEGPLVDEDVPEVSATAAAWLFQ